MLQELYSYLFLDDLITDPLDSRIKSGIPYRKKWKGDFTKFTLLSYMLWMVHSIIPMVWDSMAHTFWNEYHMITVHHVFGNQHVQKEMEKAEKQSSKERTVKVSLENFTHIHQDYSFILSFLSFSDLVFPKYLFSIPESFPNILFQPPKIS